MRRKISNSSRNGVARLRDTDPHVRAGDDQPKRDIAYGRGERSARVVRREELAEQQRGSQEQQTREEEKTGAHAWLSIPFCAARCLVRGLLRLRLVGFVVADNPFQGAD